MFMRGPHDRPIQFLRPIPGAIYEVTGFHVRSPQQEYASLILNSSRGDLVNMLVSDVLFRGTEC
jgi:hypothetical protein